MKVESIDHLVLTVLDKELSCEFYQLVLGMQVVEYGAGRTALQFGKGAHQQKINLHVAGQEIEPHARKVEPGTADFCLITKEPLEKVMEHLDTCHIPLELGPVTRTGACGPIQSLYIRDPDGNLIEIANVL